MLATNYMEADNRPRSVLIMMHIPAEHVDVAFAVASLFKVEERNLFKFECGAVGICRGQSDYMRTTISAFVVPAGR